MKDMTLEFGRTIEIKDILFGGLDNRGTREPFIEKEDARRRRNRLFLRVVERDG